MKLRFINGVRLFGLVSLLSIGCAGTGPDADPKGEDSLLGTDQQGICEGYWNGANYCWAKCGNGWHYTGWHYPQISYGQCGDVAAAFCSSNGGYYGACWSTSP